jgi:hypothetical protein
MPPDMYHVKHFKRKYQWKLKLKYKRNTNEKVRKCPARELPFCIRGMGFWIIFLPWSPGVENNTSFPKQISLLDGLCVC